MMTTMFRNKLLALVISVGLGLGATAITAAPASAGGPATKTTCPKGQHLDKNTGQCVGHDKKKH